MMGIVTILETFARFLAIIAVVAATAMVQATYEYDEVGYIRKTGLWFFAGWAALGGLVAICGKWYPTFCFIGISVPVAKFIFNGHVDNVAVVIIGALVLHIAAPAFSGQPVIWDGWTILLIVIAITGIVAAKLGAVKVKLSGHPIRDIRTILRIMSTSAAAGSETIAVSGPRPAYGLFKAVAVTSACFSLASIVALFILVA